MSSSTTTSRTKNLWMTGRTPKHAVALSEIRDTLARLAPPHLAESWDNVGLLSGQPAAPVAKILLSIDLTPEVYEEVLRQNADMLVLYHPPFFKPFKSLAIDNNEAPGLAVRLASHGVWIYSPHTALDTVSPGTNDILAAKVGATITGSFTHTSGQGTYLKLVTFVPQTHIEEVSDAIFGAGCGHIGDRAKYTRCSFRTPGTGTFQGDDSSNPTVGSPNVFEKVPEIRLETILPASRIDAVIQALRSAHPYEEPAFDLLKMETPPEAVGLGRYATLDKPMPLAAFAHRCKKALGLYHLTLVGSPTATVHKLALVAGSSDCLPLERADRSKYDTLLTGELKHHHMLAYQAANIPAVLLGHGNSERPVLQYLQDQLRQDFPKLDISQARSDRDPFMIV